MNKKNIKLICRSVSYFSQGDENIFFEWIKHIPSIVKFDGVLDELYLYFESIVIPRRDLYDLIAIFYRYEVKDMTQLKIFLNDDNKGWFFDNPNAYWHEKIFGEPRVRLVCDDATFNDGAESEEWFERNVTRITCVDELDDFGEKLHVYVKRTVISDADLEDLILLFHRYKIKDITQLKIFLNDQNKKWFFDDKESYWYERVFGDSK